MLFVDLAPTVIVNFAMFLSGRKLILIALFTGLLVLVVNLVWWFNYQRTETMLEDQLGRRLAAVTRVAAISFAPGEIDSLRDGQIDAYFETIGRLQRVRQADSLSEVFVLGADYHYYATTLLVPDTIYFLSDLSARYIDSAFYELEQNVVVTPTYRSGRIFFKSAFVPLIGSDGLPAAVLGAETSVDYFDALTDLRYNLYYASGLSLLGSLLLGVLFLLLQRRLSLAEQRLYLNETHAHLGRMVAVVAHEVKNPLMIIRGSAERLQKRTEMDEAGYIVEEVDRLNDIVSGYLEFAGSGESLLSTDRPQEFDLTEFVAGLKQHVTEKYAGISIGWSGGDLAPGLKLVGYRRSLRQVLLNLLFNGVEACREADKPVKIGLFVSAENDRVMFRVSDQGAGLSQAEVRKAFTPFYTTKQAGSGLGLYLSRNIIAQMGGTIRLQSEPRTGSTVEIRLPQIAMS